MRPSMKPDAKHVLLFVLRLETCAGPGAGPVSPSLSCQSFSHPASSSDSCMDSGPSEAGSSRPRFKRKRGHRELDFRNVLITGAPSSHAIDVSTILDAKGGLHLGSRAVELPQPSLPALDPTVLSSEAWTPWNQDAVDAPSETLAGVHITASESIQGTESVRTPRLRLCGRC
jgi:hypothetical protein